MAESIPRSVFEAHDAIRSMRTRGAGEIGRRAASALADAAMEIGAAGKGAFRTGFVAAARHLASARPTAVTLRNAINEVLSAALREPTVDAARRKARRVADAYAAGVDQARHAIAELALTRFEPGDVVLTHCHSTTAGGAITRAAKARKVRRVFSTETRPFRQGLIQSTALARAGVDVTLIVDSAVAHVMDTKGVTRVVVGADAVTPDGSLYNKIGTCQVAELARARRIPFLVCTEREKFSPYPQKRGPLDIEEREAAEVARPDEVPGVKIFNPVFDRTPPHLVTAYITDRGLVRPKDVGAFILREFKGVRRWV